MKSPLRLTIGRICAVSALALALSFAGTGCAVTPGSGGYYAVAAYPDYSPYYGYYGYDGSPFADPGYFGGGGIILSSGRHYSGGYGYHHFGHDFHGPSVHSGGFNHGSFHGGQVPGAQGTGEHR